jgi:hypothetical protein
VGKRNTLKLDLKGFDELIYKLDKLGGDVKKITEDALDRAGETIGRDTVDAVQKSNLPAGGKYSKGDTEGSIVKNPKTEWEGMIASIGVGFDYSKPGAGGFLITGTPRMAPDNALKKIYKQKRYMSEIQKDMREIFNDEIVRRMEG